MAEVNTGSDEGKKGKPKKMHLRVDFTPMVDMNMLLITFFMFCTTLSKPQTMDITVPTKDDKELTEQDKNKIKESQSITILLGEENKIYYYLGMPNYEDYTSLKVTDFAGLRDLLLERNEIGIRQMTALKLKKYKKEVSEEDFKKQSSEIRNRKEGPIVVIKPTDFSTYANLVDALDEMQICSIGTYALVDLADGDRFMLENYSTKGSLSAQISN
ncbi:ExbD/TolR family protein [Viscerimonas tarda]